MQYGFENFYHMRKIEHESMIEDILEKHPDISRYLRANIIDWIIHVLDTLKKEDHTVIFVTINMLDRYLK